MYDNIIKNQLHIIIYNFCIHNNLSYEECIELTEKIECLLESTVEKDY